MTVEKTFTLSARQLDLAIQCIARAETAGAFAGCVIPTIGAKTLAMLEAIRAENTLLETARRGLRRESWGGSPDLHFANVPFNDLFRLRDAGIADRDAAGWWVPTAKGRAMLQA